MHRAYAAYAALIVPRLGRCCQGRCQGFAPPCCCCQLATDVRIHWLPLAHESRGTTDRIPSRGYSGTGAKYAAVAAPRLPCEWFGLNESLFERTGRHSCFGTSHRRRGRRDDSCKGAYWIHQNGFCRVDIFCSILANSCGCVELLVTCRLSPSPRSSSPISRGRARL